MEGQERQWTGEQGEGGPLSGFDWEGKRALEAVDGRIDGRFERTASDWKGKGQERQGVEGETGRKWRRTVIYKARLKGAEVAGDGRIGLAVTCDPNQ